MGAKTSMLAYSDGNAVDILKTYPSPDRAAAAEAARRLFPGERLLPIEDGNLLMNTCPPDDEICISCFPGLTIVAAAEFGVDHPSTLNPHFLSCANGRRVVLHAMHSVVDWFAFAIWSEGRLERALSLSPDTGILEDVGARLPFEGPYWEGAHPADDPAELAEGEDPYPFPLHPLELGEATLQHLFGFQIEGCMGDDGVEAERIVMMRFRRGRGQPWWKFW